MKWLNQQTTRTHTRMPWYDIKFDISTEWIANFVLLCEKCYRVIVTFEFRICSSQFRVLLLLLLLLFFSQWFNTIKIQKLDWWWLVAHFLSQIFDWISILSVKISRRTAKMTIACKTAIWHFDSFYFTLHFECSVKLLLAFGFLQRVLICNSIYYK